jgi:hypothetical protein
MVHISEETEGQERETKDEVRSQKADLTSDRK